RGYGGTAHGILSRIYEGESWNVVSMQAFGGVGSMGNGGAMRAAPIGAYFHDEYEIVAAEAGRSAEVTHAHIDGQAGAIAVAVAAAWVARGGNDPTDLFKVVLRYTPDSHTRECLGKAASLRLHFDVRTAVSALGNGTRVVSHDTVPFCLWCVARHLHA